MLRLSFHHQCRHFTLLMSQIERLTSADQNAFRSCIAAGIDILPGVGIPLSKVPCQPLWLHAFEGTVYIIQLKLIIINIPVESLV